MAEPSEIEGRVDVCQPNLITGWAFDRSDPQGKVEIELRVNGRPAAAVKCSEFRGDLLKAGCGTGECAFRFNPARFLSPGLNECHVLVRGSAQVLRNGHRLVFVGYFDGAPVVLDPAAVWCTRGDPAAIRKLLNGTESAASSIHVLGPFNTGTNFAQKIISSNGLAVSSPTLAMNLFKHYTKDILEQIVEAERIQLDKVLFVVLVRNPQQWILSMMSAPYEAKFNSLRSPFSIRLEAINNTTTYRNHLAKYLTEKEAAKLFAGESIGEFWSRYYLAWLSADRRIWKNLAFLRYEDLVQHPCECIDILRVLTGSQNSRPVMVPVATAKPEHPRSSGSFWDAKLKLVEATPALSFSQPDRELLANTCSRELRDLFRYELT